MTPPGLNSKRVDHDLKGQSFYRARISRPDVIKYCATRKLYPPGWRVLLGLPVDFLHETGGMGVTPKVLISWAMKEPRELPDDAVKTIQPSAIFQTDSTAVLNPMER